MSERISDEELVMLDRLRAELESVNELFGVPSGACAEQGTLLGRALTELKARRARDLTEAERKALAWVPSVLEDLYERYLVMSAIGGCDVPCREHVDIIIAALDKLLNVEEGKT